MVDVALDGTQLLGPRTGIGTAAAAMFEGLAGRPEVSLAGYALSARAWRRLPGELPAGVRPVRRPLPANALIRLWSVCDLAPVESWAGPVDVVHGTNYVVPPARRAARLVSVWDMTPVRYPELCTRTSLMYPRLVQRAVDRGAWIHTGSRFVAEEICHHFGASPERVRVVPPPVSVPSIVAPTDFGPPYVLSIGAAEPRKDLPTLVAAFDQLAAVHPELELRIAGPAGWGEGALDEALTRAAHRHRISRMGFVPDLGGLLRNAAVLAYPSVYEGFGLPPLEAMAAGVPVVASSAGSIPEVTGGAALLVPPRDPEALAEAMGRVLDDSELRDRLVSDGRRRAAVFTPESSTAALLGTYLEMTSA